MADHAHDDEPGRPALTAITIVGTVLGAADAWWGLAWPLGPAGLVAAFAAGGVPPAISALTELFRERRLDVDLLMVLAALAAASVGAPLEGAVLLSLFSLSTTLEHRAMDRARHAIEALMGLRPDKALRRRPDGTTEAVAVDALVPGDIVVLRPGARVPVDGMIAAGSGALDESTITGESLPVRKGVGAALHEATVNLDSVLDMEVLRPVAESTVARMIALVTEAQGQRAPSERFSAWFGERYTLVVLAGALVALAAFLAVGYDLRHALYHAATLLVAASPCAIVISVPAAILSALSAAARGGVLFKGGAALETLGAVSTFAFDKTGTLTTGRQEVQRIVALDGDSDSLLALAAGLEAHSDHPIAGAIRRAAAAAGLTPVALGATTALPGEGLTGDGAWAGNARLAARLADGGGHDGIADLVAEARTVVYVGRGDRLLGAISVDDEPRATSAEGLAALRRSGIANLLMLTGDRRPVAERVGADLGFPPDRIHAELMPHDKVRIVGDLAGRGRVAFVGDGVNDAAALARADVGIAMGAAGSDVALHSADVALMSENMERLAAAHRLARRTASVIRQNLVFAMAAMALLVTGALFFELPLPLAVIGHEGGTVLVVLNGLRLLFDPIRADRGRPAPAGQERPKAAGPA